MSFSIIDIIFAALAVFILTYSFYKGFVKRISWALSSVCAFAVSFIVINYFGEYISFIKKYNRLLVFAVIFLLSLIIFNFFFKKISKSLKDKAILGTADRLLGLLVGILQTAVIIVILSFAVFTLFKDYAKDSLIINFVISIFNLKG